MPNPPARTPPTPVASAAGYAARIDAEIDALAASRYFSNRVATALRSFVDRHRGGHLCAPRETPFAQRLYGPGLPFGPNCPGLAELARDLGVTPP